MINKTIGRYEITSEIGQGAMGVVYRANDPLLERTVAIKTISLELSKDEFDEFEKRFYREASSAGRLNHPNIVTIHDVGNTENIAYMAMEYLEGEELRDILNTGEALSFDRIAEIAAQVADGLAFAHEHGVVHRDIKPSNIMILKNGVAKITDFGIALIPSASRTMAGMILGSPKYMSPEQVVGKDLDGRSDIFSLGVVLYEMLTGKSPFIGENISTIMYRILNETPIAPKTLKPELPEVFNYIIAKALAKHPDERYENAVEMAEDLRGYKTLQVPDDFYAHFDDRPRSLERRTKPRQIADQGVVLASGTLSQSAASGHHGWKFFALSAAGVVILLIGIWALNPSKPPIPSKTPAADSTAVTTVPATPLSTPPEATFLAEATLTLAVTPWGEVFVDGRSAGVSPPLNELKLTPGKHTIEIHNTGFVPYTASIEINAGESQKIRHKFN